jgi:hypothetical protein
LFSPARFHVAVARPRKAVVVTTNPLESDSHIRRVLREFLGNLLSNKDQLRPAVPKIGFRTMRPYAMNAMRRPSTKLKMMDVISPYLAGEALGPCTGVWRARRARPADRTWPDCAFGA